jgi:hypothetical protein
VKIRGIKRLASAARPVDSIAYFYDAGGNRVGKTVYYVSSLNKKPDYTWYVRDATGNVMAVYERGGQFVDTTKL